MCFQIYIRLYKKIFGSFVVHSFSKLGKTTDDELCLVFFSASTSDGSVYETTSKTKTHENLGTKQNIGCQKKQPKETRRKTTQQTKNTKRLPSRSRMISSLREDKKSFWDMAQKVAGGRGLGLGVQHQSGETPRDRRTFCFRFFKLVLSHCFRLFVVFLLFFFPVF